MRPLILANLDKLVARLAFGSAPDAVRDRPGPAFAVRAGLVVVDRPVDEPAVGADRPVDVDVRARAYRSRMRRFRALGDDEVGAATGGGRVRLASLRAP